MMGTGKRRGTWGGRRAGAGRKRRGKQQVPHVTRARHDEQHPLHVTLRVASGLPNLRKKRVFRVVKRALGLANTNGKHRDDFRITHFSVQSNHIHLVTEATDATRISRGVQGLAVRIARRVNAELGRNGKLFAQRYHARPLTTPRDVRNVLAYVLLNEQRHLYQWRKLTLAPWYFDPCSSASEFDGWRTIDGLDAPPAPTREVTAVPRTLLLSVLWRRHGLIAANEIPGAAHMLVA